MQGGSAREKILIEHKLAGTNLLRRIVGFFEEVERRFGTAVGKATLINVAREFGIQLRKGRRPQSAA